MVLRLFRRKRPDERGPSDLLPEPTVEEALLSPRPSDIFWRWARTAQLREIMPDLAALVGVSQLPAHKDDAFVHTLKVVDAIDPDPVRRWAALLHDIGKGPTYIETPEGRSRFFEHDKLGAVMAREVMEGLGIEPATVEAVVRLVALHMRPVSYRPEWSDAAVRRLYDKAIEHRGERGWHDLLALARADLRGYLPEPIDRGLWVLDSLERRTQQLLEEESRAEQEQALGPRLPLDGHELLALARREPGPWVGELKGYLQEQVESGMLQRDDKEHARQLARRWLQQMTL